MVKINSQSKIVRDPYTLREIMESDYPELWNAAYDRSLGDDRSRLQSKKLVVQYIYVVSALFVPFNNL